MDFELSEEQQLLFETARSFGSEEIAPYAAAWESAGTIPRAFLESAGALGFGAIYTDEALGGSGLSRLDATLIFEALSMACPSVAAFVSIHNMATAMIAALAAPEVRNDLLPDLIAMRRIAAYCLTEPGSGSDAAALRTRAEDTENGFLLSGTKAFISGAGLADLYIVMARTDGPGPKGISAFLIDKETPNLGFGAPEKKMGWRAQPTAEVQLDGVAVGRDRLLGERGAGFTYAMQGLDGGRLNIAACALGGAQAALDKALAYAGERQAFGRTIDSFQSLQFRLADMECDLQAARIFLRQAAWKLDRKVGDATKFCAMAKRTATDTAFRVANEALQVFGGYGYLEDYGVEKLVRDLRVHQILEGTNEIMRVIVARALLAERGRS